MLPPTPIRQSDPGAPACLLAARMLAAKGDDAAALQHYMQALRLDPDRVETLIELAVVAGSAGYRGAARTAFLRVVGIDPRNPIANAGLADLLADEGNLEDARQHYRAALAADPTFAPAHRGLAYCLDALGHPDAEPHFQAGFAGHAIARQRYRGSAPGIPLLLLVSGRGGNIPLKDILDDRIFDITAVYADFVDPAAPLPSPALIVNAIGDADLCTAALGAAERIAATVDAPIINRPEHVRRTGRQDNARRLAAVPGVVAPRIARLTRGESLPPGLRFPVLLRSPGHHTGRNFALAASKKQVRSIAATLPGKELLLIEYLDACGTDGLARKYRVMFIDGAAYPLHLAIGTDWKVHYYTSAMGASPALRAEEQRFLADMPGVLGPRAMTALAGICRTLGLDYAGVDFGLAADGSLLLFEANATMAIVPPDMDPVWDYRRPAIAAARNAAQQMLRCRAITANAPNAAPAPRRTGQG